MYTIEDLRNGKCAVINDGSLEELRQVINVAFPEDPTVIAGAYMLYIRHNDNKKYWYGIDGTSLPQQSVKDFLNQINKQMRKITWRQANEIIHIACDNWANKLAAQWGSNIVLGKDIEIKEEFYREMRYACTAAQHKLFDEIFGKDVPECPYKDGEPIWVRDIENSLWYLRYSSGKISESGCFETYIDQRKKGSTHAWKYAMPFDPNNLPVNE